MENKEETPTKSQPIPPENKEEELKTFAQYNSLQSRVQRKMSRFFPEKQENLPKDLSDKLLKQQLDEYSQQLQFDEKEKLLLERKLVAEKEKSIKLSLKETDSKDLNSLYKLDEHEIQENKAFQAQELRKYYDPNRTDSLKFGDFKHIMHLSKDGENTPNLYKQIGFPEELKKFNVGQKLAHTISSSIQNRKKFEVAMRKGGGKYILESVKRGRLGVDLYIILFGVFGTFFITYYHYNYSQPVKKITEKKRKIIDDVVEKAENSQYDIDEISIHENYNTLYKKEIEEYKLKKFKMQREIKKLENELYKRREI